MSVEYVDLSDYLLIAAEVADLNVNTLMKVARRRGHHHEPAPGEALGLLQPLARPPAIMRLQGRGLVDEREGTWYIVDPLFDEWLRRSSPLADRTTLQGPHEDKD